GGGGAEDDADEAGAVAVGGEGEAVAGGAGEAGLGADDARGAEQAGGGGPVVGAGGGGGGVGMGPGCGGRGEKRAFQGRRGQQCLVVGRGVAITAGGGEAVGVDVVGVAQAEGAGRGVHLGDEGRDAGAVGAGQGVGGVRARGQHQGVEQVPDRETVAGAQVGAGAAAAFGVADVLLGDRDRVGRLGLLEDDV